VDVRGYGAVLFDLFNVQENFFCFRHASIANSQTPGRLEQLEFFSIQGPTHYFI
jgi:hypothetical protein